MTKEIIDYKMFDILCFFSLFHVYSWLSTTIIKIYITKYAFIVNNRMHYFQQLIDAFETRGTNKIMAGSLRGWGCSSVRLPPHPVKQIGWPGVTSTEQPQTRQVP
jgi:hypothetical protein